jgi:hypothetical protein
MVNDVIKRPYCGYEGVSKLVKTWRLVEIIGKGEINVNS